MKTTQYKMVWLIYNISIEEEVADLLDKAGISCYTQWPRVHGKGLTTGPKLDNSIWPGANAAIMTVTTDEQARSLMEAVQNLRDEIGTHEGLKAFLTPVEQMTGDI
ncbi:MAG: hypothetical protein IJJ33_02925 [Victivallales bacterium]|nr:hypothetical protein [Victivallales bacterium]